ncbi:MAG: formate dehydrogenase family accessory protein FdhD [Proteobacteria bacterium]|nr:formate dehydrogenase family accessory protein FdhD [Pseudomonadota bacterium]
MNCTIHRYQKGKMEKRSDAVAPEEPLEIRIESEPFAVLLRSPGSDIELTIGFLFTEGLIEEFKDIKAISHIDNPTTPKGNTVDVRLSSGMLKSSIKDNARHLFASSACGVCGKASIDRIFTSTPPLPYPPSISPEQIISLPSKLREAQKIFSKTGGLHAAGLFDFKGNLLTLHEDIGRHNAVDKVIGNMIQEEREDELEQSLLVVSGRAGFEIVQKSLTARIPWLLAIGAPSSLAVDLARKGNLGLIGFLKTDRFNTYHGSVKTEI